MPHHLHIQSLSILIAVTLATKNLDIPKYYACQGFFLMSSLPMVTNSFSFLRGSQRTEDGPRNFLPLTLQATRHTLRRPPLAACLGAAPVAGALC